MATQRFEDIVADFDFLDDWEDRYRYVIDLGKDLDQLDEALKGPATRVDGCASQVWIAARLEGSGAGAVFDFDGDSDAMIVRGLIAVLHTLYSGLTVESVVRVDAVNELARLGLDQHLSSQRANGLRAMINRIQAIARTALSASGKSTGDDEHAHNA